MSASPRHFRSRVRRPVSGLTSLDMSPSQDFTQWPIDTPTLAYRCGDSTGMAFHLHAPVSRLTAAANLRCGTLHDSFRHLMSAEARIIQCGRHPATPDCRRRPVCHKLP
ncbi:hypothetical protein ACCAA_210007 [Candidatus Accumulibacter aalborgensis]|uniref:Uncharacterized protein n=1 Tax=Candidatus Accumulibacter aalborgensis TaxID=1860102 RepID=A0A1A8XN90_9PROT|nr:hypothetical protein ACCAA_210007 [Candidatus Accumulibacter aalborgensis]